MIRITADLRETVIAIARQAGAAIMEIYAGSFDVAHKDDASPLTAADLAAPDSQGRIQRLAAPKPRLPGGQFIARFFVFPDATSEPEVDPAQGLVLAFD